MARELRDPTKQANLDQLHALVADLQAHASST
jgi:hypothetical protein